MGFSNLRKCVRALPNGVLGTNRWTGAAGRLLGLRTPIILLLAICVVGEAGASDCYPKSLQMLEDGELHPTVDYFAGLHLMNSECPGYDPERAQAILGRAVAFDGSFDLVAAYARLLDQADESDAEGIPTETLHRIAAISALAHDSAPKTEPLLMDALPESQRLEARRTFRELARQPVDARVADLHRDRRARPVLNGIAFQLCRRTPSDALSQEARFQCSNLFETVNRTNPYPIYREFSGDKGLTGLYILAMEGYNPALLKGARLFLKHDDEDARAAAFQWLSRSESPNPEIIRLREELAPTLSKTHRKLIEIGLATDGFLHPPPDWQ